MHRFRGGSELCAIGGATLCVIRIHLAKMANCPFAKRRSIHVSDRALVHQLVIGRKYGGSMPACGIANTRSRAGEGYLKCSVHSERPR
jgi:hypothetical protein